MRARKWWAAVAAGVMVGAWPFVATGGGQASSAAAAAPQTAYQMPFMCGENWRGTTRSGHSPSTLSIDWNRTADKGMPVVSSAAGTVITAQKTDKGGYGKFVLIDHGNKERTRYAHLASVTVTAGQAVARSEESRGGQEGVRTGRSRWRPYHKK